MANFWMFRAGRGGENLQDFLDHGIVAFGDTKLGKLPPSIKKDELLRLYAQHHPEEKEGSRASWASQLLRLLRELKVGDGVATYDQDSRLYYLGKITSEYEWNRQPIRDKPHLLKVQWSHKVPRDFLSAATRNSLGSTLTLFKLPPEAVQDLQSHQVTKDTLPESTSLQKALKPADREEESTLQADVLAKADGFIEDAINRLDCKQLPELVAGILRAMGYRTKVSAQGPDRGVDVFASPDGLGLQEPRIFVEVKHRPGSAMGAGDIRSFLGGRKPGDRCLYVSTGSFTKEARYEAERATVPLHLLDLQALRQLLVDNYEKLDAEVRALVPLKRLYWPNP